MTNFASLKLGNVMMHQITKSAEGSPDRFDLGLTDEAVEMSAENIAFLTNRFVRALSGKSNSVVEDPSKDSETPKRIKSIWTDEEKFVDQSQKMAEDLRAIQPGTALAGLLVVAEATLGNEEALLIAKVEHQDAMRIDPQTNEAGHRIFHIERIRELVFGDSARIYKVAVLSKVASAGGQVTGYFVDDQNGFGYAAYFSAAFSVCA